MYTGETSCDFENEELSEWATRVNSMVKLGEKEGVSPWEGGTAPVFLQDKEGVYLWTVGLAGHIVSQAEAEEEGYKIHVIPLLRLPNPSRIRERLRKAFYNFPEGIRQEIRAGDYDPLAEGWYCEREASEEIIFRIENDPIAHLRFRIGRRSGRLIAEPEYYPGYNDWVFSPDVGADVRKWAGKPAAWVRDGQLKEV
ncbi:MAG: hypothetical protein QXU79_02335 [Candidatus Micrarchaeaceae archaeon]